MGAAETKFLDIDGLEGLIKSINSMTTDDTPDIIPEFKDLEGKTTHIPMPGIHTTGVGEYLLTQADAKGREKKIGYVHVKTGKTGINGFAQTYYEKAHLRLYKPLKLKSGKTIPACSIRIKVKRVEEVVQEPTRKNKVVEVGFVKRKHDELEELIPTKHLLTKSYIQQLAANGQHSYAT